MRVDEVFSEAAKIESRAARAAYLDHACAGDAALRKRVEALLAAHDQAASFLETAAGATEDQTSAPLDPLDAGAKPVATMAPAYRPVTEGPGTMVGRYKLLQNIGEGGMGVVYMAEQEKPVRRRVALKIIKPGMDSAQVIVRFEAERQALAMMDHPNIARVLDAGCTDTGRPYFVMELVQGIPITKYCDDKQLDTHARLELFVQVCNAIQHAHQKGIIHRDLKPSNVLVAIYDAKPVPKIIDFGVAKALHQRLTEKTMFTQFGAVVGTLEYMSPEQADMDLMGTDTRSDIYSLGVLLYELLTGSTPMDGKKLRSLGYAEMLKTIREVEPPKPSTRLSQSINEVADISARRQTEPRRLQKLVAGDLDWIVMKCLEKDRARRYETANGLAMDIQRHLQDEAVTASPPGQLYKFQKLVRRNKFACAAVASVMMALLLGLAGSLWQAARAHHEAVRAQNETTLAQREADRANEALSNLQTAMPSIVGEAHALTANGQFDQAIDRLDLAAQLQPDLPDLLVAKGDLLLCQLKVSEADSVYRDVLQRKPGYAPAQAKVQLCDQILAAPRSDQGKLNLESLAKIYSALEPQKRSVAELKAVSSSYTEEKERLWNYWLPRLQSLPMFAERPRGGGDPDWSGRLEVRNDGQLILYLGDLDLTDVSQLKDLPVADLYLSHTQIARVRGGPVTALKFDGSKVTDVQALAHMPSLENVTVPIFARNIEALRKLPKLKRLSFSTTLTVIDEGEMSRIIAESTAAQIRANQLHADPKFNPSEAMRRFADFDIAGSWIQATPDTTAEQFWKEYPALSGISRLRDSTTKPSRLVRRPDGTWTVEFNNKDFSDLSVLQGMPISVLGLQGTSVTDLTPLRGMPLKDLQFQGCKVADLTPLKGMPLKVLFADYTKVTDLGPLQGMPLDFLAIDGTPVSDLSPLRGLPLTKLRLGKCTNLTDLSPLADLKQLTALVLPPNFTDFDFLHTLPKLQRLSYENNNTDGGPDKSTDQFWDSVKAAQDQPWLIALTKAKIVANTHRLADGSWELTLDHQPISDLSMLKGAPISRLSIASTPVADLSPLRGMKLTYLRMSGTKVTDLSPIQGMPITNVTMSQTDVRDLTPLIGMPLRDLNMPNCKQITDLSPLADITTLQNIVLPPNAKNIEILRKLPNVRQIGFTSDTRKPPDQFWADYDKTGGIPASQP